MSKKKLSNEEEIKYLNSNDDHCPYCKQYIDFQCCYTKDKLKDECEYFGDCDCKSWQVTVNNKTNKIIDFA